MPSFITLSLLTTATFTGLACRGPVFNNTIETQPRCIERVLSSNANLFLPNVGDVSDVRSLGLEETTWKLLFTQIQLNEFEKQLEPFKSKIITLMEQINEDEDNHNLLIEYVSANENNVFFKLAVIDFFSQLNSDSNKLSFIDIILSSDIDIFVDWYKSALEIASKSANVSLSSRAKDILHYYSKGFSKV